MPCGSSAFQGITHSAPAGSESKHRAHVESLEELATAQVEQLHQHHHADDLRTAAAHELRGGSDRAARGQHVVDYQHARTRTERVFVCLQVFEPYSRS